MTDYGNPTDSEARPPDHGTGHVDVDAARLSGPQAATVKRLALGVAGVGILATGVAAALDWHRFQYSWLTAFLWLTTLGLGGLIFVLIQHVTKAGWSVAARRQGEWLAGILPICALLFIPVAVAAPHLYEEWWTPEKNEELSASKHFWLTPGMFYGRAVLYFAIWIGVQWFFRSRSRRQDETGDAGLTRSMERLGPPLTIATAFSLAFAGFDWVMSMDPRWYSTIFGVYIFAGGFVTALAAIGLMTIALQSKGLFKKVSNVEHLHDIGKLTFGFIVFWTYIAFAQFFLIWYANIPEETHFYLNRWTEGWRGWSLLLLFGHFVVPFCVLLSRTAKRVFSIHAAAAVLIVVIHWVDMYWLVMPFTDKDGLHLSWVDFACWLGAIGVLAAWLATRAAGEPLYPLKDPRLAETMRVNNP